MANALTSLRWKPVGSLTTLEARHDADISFRVVWRQCVSRWELFIITEYFKETVPIGRYASLDEAKDAAAAYMKDNDR